jgi:hypothetical protein
VTSFLPGRLGEPAATSLGGRIVSLGGAFMVSRYAKAAADEQGLRGVWTSYFAGRAGVLGDVDADVVAAAVAFFPADVVRTAWDAARATVDDVRQSSARYARACHEWGRPRLGAFAGSARLAELAEPVVREADVAGLPLFAAWRALPLPDDADARVAQLLFLLREHRGGLHAAAVLATGLTPLQAVLAGPGGRPNAEFFGWTPPYEDPAPYAELRADAERRTDLAAARAYAVLDDTETAELDALLEKASAHARERATLERR